MANAISNAASNPGLVVLANKALIAAKPALAKAAAFTLDISDDAVAPGTTLKVGIYDSNPASSFGASHNYGTGDGTIGFADVTFKQFVKSYNFTDAQLTQVPAGIFNRAGEACGVGCGIKVGAEIEGCFTAAGMTGTEVKIPHGTTADTMTKAILAKIVAACKSAPNRTVLALDPTWFYPVAALFDAAAYGGPDAIKNGVLDGGVLGLKAIVPVKMPDGVIGALCPEDSLVVAIRKVPCASQNAYDEVIDEVDADTGFGFQIRRFADPDTGTNKVSGSVMVGAARAQGAKMQKVTIAAS